MPSRRGGRKSHHGCRNCKTRHLKCDENFPTCGRCRKRNETCVPSHSSFRSATPSTPQHAPISELPWPGDVTDSSHTMALVLPDICDKLVAGVSMGTQGDWLDDMLLKHYLAVVSWTLNEDHRVVLAYRQLVPELADNHVSLKHAVLTISGSHCVATLSSQQDVAPGVVKALIERTVHHHTCMLSLFAAQISLQPSQSMSHDDCIATTLTSIFVFTSFLTQIQPAFQETAPPGSPGAIDKAVAMLNLMGPISTFFAQYQGEIAASQLHFFEGDYLPKVEDLPVPAEAERGLDAVAALCDKSTHRELYAAAVKGLRHAYRIVALNPGTIGGRFGWIIGEEAISMANCVYRRLPEALIVLAYWAASLIPWPHWWGTDFAVMIILEVDQTLSEEYGHLLEWPRSRLLYR